MIDPIAYYIGNRKENDADDWQVVANGFRDVIDATGCCIVIMHHEGYAKGHPRGSTKILDLAASSTGLSTTDDEKRIELKQGRPPKNSAPIPDYEAYIKQVEIGIDENGETITSPVVVEHRGLSIQEFVRLPINHAKVLRLFITSGQEVLQRKYITTTVGLANDTIGEILKALVSKRYVMRDNRQYRITPEGREALEDHSS